MCIKANLRQQWWPYSLLYAIPLSQQNIQALIFTVRLGEQKKLPVLLNIENILTIKLQFNTLSRTWLNTRNNHIYHDTNFGRKNYLKRRTKKVPAPKWETARSYWVADLATRLQWLTANWLIGFLYILQTKNTHTLCELPQNTKLPGGEGAHF